MTNGFLPVSTKDMAQRKIKQLDFVYVTGDAYVDHPSFAHAVISRVLEHHGYSVGIIAQPDWKDDKSITVLGEPRLKRDEERMPFLPEESWESGRIMQRLSTVI